MNISHLQNEASDLYFALKSDMDTATRIETLNDYNRFSDKLMRYVTNGQLKLAIARALLKIIDIQ